MAKPAAAVRTDGRLLKYDIDALRRVIAVAGGKGGSGKTTTTLGLANALTRRGARVIAADADWDLPNLARLATERTDLLADRQPVPIDEAMAEEWNEFLSVRQARKTPTVLAEPPAPQAVDAHETFATLADMVPADAATLLDCPAGASPDATAPLRAADRSILVTPLHRAALRDTAKTAAMARRLDCPPLGVVATRTTRVPSGLTKLFGCPVLGKIPTAAPMPLATAAVRAAYDRVAASIAGREGCTQWRIAE